MMGHRRLARNSLNVEKMKYRNLGGPGLPDPVVGLGR